MSANEKQQIQSILKGDTSAFSYFVDHYQDMAITIAYRICGNRQDAEDIVQNSFVKAFHSLPTFRTDSKFSTWFYRIVYNTAITTIRSAVFRTEYTDYKDVDSSEQSDWNILAQIDEKERSITLNKAMESLPAGESLILTLFYLEENSIKEIEEITGLNEGNIKVRLHRARKNLKSILEQSINKHEIWTK